MATRKTATAKKLDNEAKAGGIEITKSKTGGTPTARTRKPRAKTLKVEPKALPVVTAPVPSPAVEPTRDQIAEHAYYLFLQRGCSHGADAEDWLQAERDLCSAGR